METFAITFKDDLKTITMEADFYEMDNGFISLYKDFSKVDNPEKFASYAAGNVLHIVLQNKYTEEEILKQMKDA